MQDNGEKTPLNYRLQSGQKFGLYEQPTNAQSKDSLQAEILKKYSNVFIKLDINSDLKKGFQFHTFDQKDMVSVTDTNLNCENFLKANNASISVVQLKEINPGVKCEKLIHGDRLLLPVASAPVSGNKSGGKAKKKK